MLALTLKAPWGFAVTSLGKRIENRSWAPSPKQLAIGDRFAIHAGVEPVGGAAWKRAWVEACELADKHGGARPDPLTCFKPGIVAIATFGGITTDGYGECNCARNEHDRHRDACPSRKVDPWFDADVEGNKGWLLQDVLVLPTPIPCKGAQGLWTVPDDVIRQIESLK